MLVRLDHLVRMDPKDRRARPEKTDHKAVLETMAKMVRRAKLVFQVDKETLVLRAREEPMVTLAR